MVKEDIYILGIESSCDEHKCCRIEEWCYPQ